MSQVFSLPNEIQEIIAMSYYNNQTSEAWTLKIDGYKATIKINAKEIWMESESKMSFVYLFQIHWCYHKPKILLNCVDHSNIKYCERIISFIDVVNDFVIQYNASRIMDHDIVYDFTLLFTKTCSIDNPINTKPRFQRIFQ